MIIHQHFSVSALCNTYLVASKATGEALLIDPGSVELDLINLIEANGLELTTVLLTHGHLAHREGLGTLEKIYDVSVWASEYSRVPFPFNAVGDHDVLHLCNMEIEAIHVPGHSLDSVVWKIGGALFTGDVLHSGWIGRSGGYREQALLLQLIEERLFTLDENTLLFPGHGSPSKLRIETLFNPALRTRSIRRAAP